MQNSVKPKKISPYFNFCNQHRQKIKAQLKESGKPTSAPALTKALSELWRSLSESEKQAYNQLLKEAATDGPAEAPEIEKGSDSTRLEQLKVAEATPFEGQKSEDERADLAPESAAASQGEQNDEFSHEITESSAEDPDLVKCRHQQTEETVPAFPLARVKRIIKLDKDVRLVSSDALTLITQATQLFLEHFAEATYAAALQKKHKSIRLEDMKLAIKNERRVEDFLGDALKDLLSNEKEGPGNDSESDDDDDEAEKVSKVHSVAIKPNELIKKAAAITKPNPTAPPGSRRIMDFFGDKVCSAEIPGSAVAFE